MRAGVSAGVVGLLERGQAARMTVSAVRRIAEAMELRLGWDAGYRGPELARLRDADHSHVAQAVTSQLAHHGWLVVPEASFNRYGDRGRIDLLAYHPDARMLLAIEIKTLIVDVQDVLGNLNVKARVAPHVAQSLGWRPSAVLPTLIVLDTRTNRRRIADHDRLFARLSLRGPAALRWLRRPIGSLGGLLLFRSLPNRSTGDRRQAGRQRMRRQRTDSSVAASGEEARSAPGRCLRAIRL